MVRVLYLPDCMITANLFVCASVHPMLTISHTINLAKDLVTNLLIPDPKKRATVYAALKSSWITSDFVDLERAYRERIRSVAS